MFDYSLAKRDGRWQLAETTTGVVVASFEDRKTAISDSLTWVGLFGGRIMIDCSLQEIFGARFEPSDG